MVVGGMHGGGHTCMAGGVHGGGVYMAGGACVARGVHGGSMCGRGGACMAANTVNERAVRILLECILVYS